MTGSEHWLDRYQRFLAEARNTGHVDVDGLIQLQDDLEELIFGFPRDYSTTARGVDANDAHLVVLLDVIDALAQSEIDDPAYWWTRGHILHAVGRHLEAAKDFLLAAARFDNLARTGDKFIADAHDWSESSLHHAARNLALGGERLSAVALLSQLSSHSRSEVMQLLRG